MGDERGAGGSTAEPVLDCGTKARTEQATKARNARGTVSPASPQPCFTNSSSHLGRGDVQGVRLVDPGAAELFIST